MLYYAYRQFWFFKVFADGKPGRSPATNASTTDQSSTIEELCARVGLACPDRMSEYDECWPVRYAYERAYTRRTNIDTPSMVSAGQSIREDPDDGGVAVQTMHVPTFSECARRRVRRTCRRVWRACVCTLCTCTLYMAMCTMCCAPCVYHYTCRRRSLIHRNRFAKTCTRIASTSK
jgi:hypothetical protein